MLSCVFSLWYATELQNFDYEFDVVKEEADVHAVGHDGKAGSIDHMYMKVHKPSIPVQLLSYYKLCHSSLTLVLSFISRLCTILFH